MQNIADLKIEYKLQFDTDIGVRWEGHYKFFSDLVLRKYDLV